jgi:sarcosine oxidase subunit gamma
MPDLLRAQTAFGEPLAQLTIAGDAGVCVHERTDYALAIVLARRGQAEALANRVSVWGIALPERPVRGTHGALAFLGLGPGRWLATLDDGAASPHGSYAWAKSLARDLAGHASVSDQTDGYAVLQIGGPKARALLAKGTTVDLHPRAFRAGDVAVTQIAHIGVMLWQLDDQPTYEIAAFRSFAGSLWHWLAGSAAEFGLAAKMPPKT